jgi:hypothetical protein
VQEDCDLQRDDDGGQAPIDPVLAPAPAPAPDQRTTHPIVSSLKSLSISRSIPVVVRAPVGGQALAVAVITAKDRADTG